MRNFLIRLVGLTWIVVFGFHGLAGAADEAGKITRIAGEASVERDGESRPLALADPVLVDDVVVTGADARLEVSLLDDSVLTLGADTRLVIDSYIFDPDKLSGSAAVSVLRGVFQAVAGVLGGGGDLPGTFEVTTPVATIGIRGTSFWGGIEADKLEVVLLDGKGIYIRTPAGRVDVVSPGVGVTVRPGDTDPPIPYRWSPRAIAFAAWTVSFPTP